MNEGGIKSKISGTEWFLIFLAVLFVDIIQFVLDIFAIGAIANRLIDVFVGMSLLFYFYMRGLKLTGARMGSIAAAFVAEMVPILDAAPLWTLDVIYIWSGENADKAISMLGFGSGGAIAPRIKGKMAQIRRTKSPIIREGSTFRQPRNPSPGLYTGSTRNTSSTTNRDSFNRDLSKHREAKSLTRENETFKNTALPPPQNEEISSAE